MLKPLSKLLIMITLLVAFIGQTVTYYFMTSYHESKELQTSIQQQALMNDNNSANLSENSDDCCEVECCEGECICPVNTCASIAYLNNSLPLSQLAVLGESLLSLATKNTHFIATSLYRPPIFTS